MCAGLASNKQAAMHRPAAPDAAGSHWYEEADAQPLLTEGAARPLSEDEVEALRVRADAALAAAKDAFEREKGAPHPKCLAT